MKMGLFSIHDAVAGVFMSPFVARSRVDAVRQILASKDSPEVKATPVGSKPYDFSLYEIASFDDESGVVAPLSVPDRVDSVGNIWAAPAA